MNHNKVHVLHKLLTDFDQLLLLSNHPLWILSDLESEPELPATAMANKYMNLPVNQPTGLPTM